MKILVMFLNEIVSELCINSDYVNVINFSSNILRLPFGNKTKVTQKEYLEYLESRCIPKSRDNIKEFLSKLELKVFDPKDITEITNGFMAEDKIWLQFEGKNKTWEEVRNFNLTL